MSLNSYHNNTNTNYMAQENLEVEQGHITSEMEKKMDFEQREDENNVYYIVRTSDRPKAGSLAVKSVETIKAQRKAQEEAGIPAGLVSHERDLYNPKALFPEIGRPESYPMVEKPRVAVRFVRHLFDMFSNDQVKPEFQTAYREKAAALLDELQITPEDTLVILESATGTVYATSSDGPQIVTEKALDANDKKDTPYKYLTGGKPMWRPDEVVPGAFLQRVRQTTNVFRDVCKERGIDFKNVLDGDEKEAGPETVEVRGMMREFDYDYRMIYIMLKFLVNNLERDAAKNEGREPKLPYPEVVGIPFPYEAATMYDLVEMYKYGGPYEVESATVARGLRALDAIKRIDKEDLDLREGDSNKRKGRLVVIVGGHGQTLSGFSSIIGKATASSEKAENGMPFVQINNGGVVKVDIGYDDNGKAVEEWTFTKSKDKK